MSAITRFLGDTPLLVALKLVVLSFLVGVVMAAFNLSAWNVVETLRDFAEWVWSLGFETFFRFVDYFILGAAIVIPVFLLMRLLKYRRPS